MSSINSVGSSSSAAAQYQEYLQNLQASKKAESVKDDAATKAVEKVSVQADADSDGD
jgi:hypothetical protein